MPMHLWAMLRQLFDRATPEHPEQAQAPAPRKERPQLAGNMGTTVQASAPQEGRSDRQPSEVHPTPGPTPGPVHGRDTPPEHRLERRSEADEPFVGPEYAQGGARSAQVARLMADYLGARAEEALGLLFEAVSRGTADEVARAMQATREALSLEIAGVQESVSATQRESSRMGRELMRTGATLEGVRTSLADVGAALQRLEATLEAERESVRETRQEIREEVWAETLGDLLAALDGLEAALDDARDIARALAEVGRQIDDPVVRRWWRAMGEATGTKRALPVVPVSDVESWLRGLEITHRRLKDALERRGVRAIEATGRPFDPHLHEAVAVAPCPPDQDGIVLREEQRGYQMTDRVIRLAQVVVGRAEPPVEPAEPTEKVRRPHRRGASAVAAGGDQVSEGTPVDE